MNIYRSLLVASHTTVECACRPHLHLHSNNPEMHPGSVIAGVSELAISAQVNTVCTLRLGPGGLDSEACKTWLSMCMCVCLL